MIHKRSFLLFLLGLWCVVVTSMLWAAAPAPSPATASAADACPREHLLMDRGWRFAYGHPSDVKEDFNHATGYFSYLAKAGNGDGPADPEFDDRSWRVVDLPHDWAVEQPFDGEASHSHGYKTVGRTFPDSSIGWYRKRFAIPASDLGRRISLQLDGVHRDAVVWFNGFYLGRESSGYSDVVFDVTDYVNYGGDNVVALRVDATIEEGWFYEGAGIYRHVWLNKTAPLHVAHNGTFVTSQVSGDAAVLTVQTTLANDGLSAAAVSLTHAVVDANQSTVSHHETDGLRLAPLEQKVTTAQIPVSSPLLWSLEEPHLYKLVTTVLHDDTIVDSYETFFGIRTIRFDPDQGFFLNGKHVILKGTNNHQDHAGVGTAIPDALQSFRVKRLKSMGSNAYRSAHNPPTPELLDACDRLGMLVMCENRLMGTTPEILDRVRRMMLRDRNHPSVIIWSLGNEEWKIEGNATGTRIGRTMRAFAQRLDPTRPFTVASSGGWGHGVGVGMDVMGFNYLRHGDIEQHHRDFPLQVGIGTEESTTQGTRGIYADDREHGHMAPTDRTGLGGNIEVGWQYYAARPYLAGLFFWTGFDYRGESNPLDFPAVSSQYGILDTCGFAKDPYHYLRAWWTDEPYLHLTPHWSWPGQEGKPIKVWAFSNCEEVELVLNGTSLGRKAMPRNAHLEWEVAYQPGVVLAKGYESGNEIVSSRIETTGPPAAVKLLADRPTLAADGEDVGVITVQVTDSEGRVVPTADEEITFGLEGPGTIIGVGNGDPACHEPDRYYREVQQILITGGRIATVEPAERQPELEFRFDDSSWPLYVKTRRQMIFPREKTVVVRAQFDLPSFADDTQITLYSQSLAIDQSIYVNGHCVARDIPREDPHQVYPLDHAVLKPGRNVYAVIGSPLYKRSQWEDLNTDAGLIQVVTPARPSKRSVFNGLAQVIVQAGRQAGELTLTGAAPGLSSGELSLSLQQAQPRPSVDAE